MKLANLKSIILPILTILVLISPSSFSKADSLPLAEKFPFVYLFHLYYGGGRLVADKDFEFKYDLIAEQFVQPQLDTDTPYRGEVISVSGNIIGNFKFDLTTIGGKISVKGPHFSNARKVDFYNDKDELLLTIQVSESSVCNEDGICNEDVGENSQNCSTDCKVVTTTTLPPKQQPFFNRMFSFTNLVGAVLVVVLIFLLKWLRRKKNEIPQTPQI